MRYAVLFSGQGTQHSRMFPWLREDEFTRVLLQPLRECIGGDWRELLAAKEPECSNALAQPVIVGTGLAAWTALQRLLPEEPEVVGGYSVGELTALAAVGAYNSDRAISLAQQRASFMDAAVGDRKTGLLAIGGIQEGAVLSGCPGLECAIRIDGEVNIFGGADEDLDAAQQILRERAQCRRIRVPLASHTSWMRPAADAFAHVIAGLDLRTPRCRVALNALGTTSCDVRDLSSALSIQLATCVQWGACMSAVAERNPDSVIEVGGGHALASMWNSRYPDIPARALDEFRTVEGAAAWLVGRG